MPTLNSSRLPPPEGAVEFEKMVVEAAKIRWKNVGFVLNGRSGQKQNGVDIFGTNIQVSGVGIQCKNTIHNLTKSLLVNEIEQAKYFNPPLKELYFATTLPHDVNIQETVRFLSKESVREGLFSISILFWGDLTKDENTLYQFYPHLRFVKEKQHDEIVLDRVRRVLPYDGSIGFIKNNSFPGKRFQESILSQLADFYHGLDQPDDRFVDQTLELLRMDLRLKIEKYYRVLGYHYTQIANSGGILEFHEYSDNKMRDKIINEFYDVSNGVVSVYNELFNPINMPR